MEEKDKTYTAADFASYHAGTMPVAEMHALEKAALEDPFLADALEGYAYSESPEKDIAELRELLSEKRKKKKAFSIASFAENKWWRIAALFIIVFGVGYLFYTNTNHSASNEIAQNDNKKLPAKVEAPSPVLKDLDSGHNDVAFEDKSPGSAKINKPSLPKINADIQHEKISRQNLADEKEDATSLMMEKTNSFADSLAESQPIIKKDSLKQYVFKGSVIDETGAPVANAFISNNNKSDATMTNKDGNFSFASADSSVQIVAQGVGFNDKSVSLKEGAQSSITLERNTKHLDEVVVVGYGSKRKKALSSPAKSLEGKAAGIATSNLALQPFPVSDKFTKYLLEKLIPVYDENNERLSGEVVLSFTINKKGRPGHVDVLTSTCKECEEQAIHLVETWPDWVGPTDIRGTVEIKF